MSPAWRATRDLALTVLLASIVVGVAKYASTHPYAAEKVIMPILTLLFFAGMWGFFYMMAKAR